MNRRGTPDACPVLAGVSPEDLRRDCPKARIVTVQHRGKIYRQGEPARAIFCVLEGQVIIARVNPAGAILTTAVFVAGDFFGSALGAAEEAEDTARAKGAVSVWRVPIDEFRSLPFLATVEGAESKDLLLRDEDVQVLHTFESRSSAESYLASRLFGSDVVGGAEALPQGGSRDPDLRTPVRASMTVPVWMLLGFATWTALLLLFTGGIYRWGRILTGRVPIRNFPTDAAGREEWYRRATRAHANCIENGSCGRSGTNRRQPAMKALEKLTLESARVRAVLIPMKRPGRNMTMRRASRPISGKRSTHENPRT